MGLGKTPQAIIASNDLNRVLVVCPACAKINWQREFIKWGGRKVNLAQGDPQYQKQSTITSYDYLARYPHLFTHPDANWDLVILDEAHFLKEPTAKRTKAILGNDGVIHRAKRCWALTGTPAPNHAGELWTLLFTFGKTRLSYEGFISRYCTAFQTSRYGRMQITGSNTKNTPELKRILQLMSKRRLKKDVLKELPPIFHSVLHVENPNDPISDHPELAIKLKAEYNRIAQSIGFDEANPDEDRLLKVLQFMSRSVSSLRRYHALQKIKPVAELINGELESKAYEKIVIFAIHKDVIENVRKSIATPSVVITGSTPMRERQIAIDSFQEPGGPKVFIGNIKAAGTAITLTAANQVLFIEQEWTPGDNAQAAMRCHRIGQEKPVTVRYVSLVNSFDDQITAILSRKAQELSTFID